MKLLRRSDSNLLDSSRFNQVEHKRPIKHLCRYDHGVEDSKKSHDGDELAGAKNNNLKTRNFEKQHRISNMIDKNKLAKLLNNCEIAFTQQDDEENENETI